MVFSFLPGTLKKLALAKVSLDLLCSPCPLGCFHCHLPPPYGKATQTCVIFLGKDLSVQHQRGLHCTTLFFEHFQNDTHWANIQAHTHKHAHVHNLCLPVMKLLYASFPHCFALQFNVPSFCSCICLEFN